MDMNDNTLRIHFIGIGGAGMGAIASILLDRGFPVSGSDVADHEHTRQLRERGALVYLGHDRQHVEDVDVVVYSTAIASDNEELQAAKDRHLPVLHRSQMLAELMQEGYGIAIAGAHGKTTTTSMVAWVLEQAGLDPTFLVGGISANFNMSAKVGKGKHIVAEADESDGSFLNYLPMIEVVTNIEADHLEHYQGSFANLVAAYQKFVSLLSPEGLLVASLDDEVVAQLLPDLQTRVLTYTLHHQDADYQAENVRFVGHGTVSSIYFRDTYLGELELAIPGVHNVGNAMAAIAVANEVGIDFLTAVKALKEFRGALRRFQVLYDHDDILLVDDYAHHPTEIRAMIRAAKETKRRVVAVFQPQRYTRTFHLFEDFARAFADADDVIIVDIYSPAGEMPIAGVSAKRLVDAVRKESHVEAKFYATKDEVVEYLSERVKPGDLVLFMGAGDIWKAGRMLAEQLETESTRLG